MSRALSRRSVRLRWLLRERALRSCVSAMMSAARCRIEVTAFPVSHHDWTKAAAAVRTWQTVNSWFFPPPLLMHAREEQVGQSRDGLVPRQAHVGPALEVIEA